MSKAFTKDDRPDEPVVVRHRPALPEGLPNYVTRRGLQAFRDLLATTEPGVRRSELEQRIATAVLVAAPVHREEIRFGARVKLRDAAGALRQVRIVGVDEADPATGLVAFMAPLARALLGRGVGDRVSVRAPGSIEELEVLAVDYDEDGLIFPVRFPSRRALGRSLLLGGSRGATRTGGVLVPTGDQHLIVEVGKGEDDVAQDPAGIDEVPGTDGEHLEPNVVRSARIGDRLVERRQRRIIDYVQAGLGAGSSSTADVARAASGTRTHEDSRKTTAAAAGLRSASSRMTLPSGSKMVHNAGGDR